MQGNSLLREDGDLRMGGLHLSGYCSAVQWNAQWTLSEGKRNYDGQTNTQARLKTTSRLKMHHGGLQAWLPLPRQSSWALGAMLGYRDISRDIASRGSVLGYPEHFRYLQAGFGGRYKTEISEQLQLTLTGWAGAGPKGRVKVDLPRADPTTLPLGNSRFASLGITIGSLETAQLEKGWSWEMGASYRYDMIGAGEARPLMRGAALVGSASQPQIVQRHTSLTLATAYRF